MKSFVESYIRIPTSPGSYFVLSTASDTTPRYCTTVTDSALSQTQTCRKTRHGGSRLHMACPVYSPSELTPQLHVPERTDNCRFKAASVPCTKQQGAATQHQRRRCVVQHKYFGAGTVIAFDKARNVITVAFHTGYHKDTQSRSDSFLTICPYSRC